MLARGAFFTKAGLRAFRFVTIDPPYDPPLKVAYGDITWQPMKQLNL